MSDLPKSVSIHEEGPREGFQIEPGPIPTDDKIHLIEALAETGLKHIQACSFVNPKLVPGWADADDVIAGLETKTGVHYTALWFNARGLERALQFKEKLTITGSISLAASDAFSKKNLNRSHQDNIAAMRKQTEVHLSHGVPVNRISVMAAFGCNFQGDVPVETVLKCAEDGFQIAADYSETIEVISLADTMGWAVPPRIEKVVGAVRERWPDITIALHLHDTRGIAVANAHTALKMGVARFDTTVGGLGGCPFAAHKGAAGNICTEELVLLCEEMGIATGVDLDALIEVGRMAETMVGHVLPSELVHAGSLNAFREAIRS
jgi:isopropylmalate/homocitrate/citramalate synthase